MKQVLREINRAINQGHPTGKTYVGTRELRILLSHFEALDSRFRAMEPRECGSNTESLAHEIQAACKSMGYEDTLDVVMFTVAELRKEQTAGLRQRAFAARRIQDASMMTTTNLFTQGFIK